MDFFIIVMMIIIVWFLIGMIGPLLILYMTYKDDIMLFLDKEKDLDISLENIVDFLIISLYGPFSLLRSMQVIIEDLIKDRGAG